MINCGNCLADIVAALLVSDFVGQYIEVIYVVCCVVFDLLSLSGLE